MLFWLRAYNDVCPETSAQHREGTGQVLADAPLIRIAYQQARLVEIAPGRYAKEVIIFDADEKVMRVLAARNIMVRLEHPGMRTYHMRLHQLLKRLRPGPTQGTWAVRVSVTSQLAGGAGSRQSP